MINCDKSVTVGIYCQYIPLERRWVTFTWAVTGIKVADIFIAGLFDILTICTCAPCTLTKCPGMFTASKEIPNLPLVAPSPYLIRYQSYFPFHFCFFIFEPYMLKNVEYMKDVRCCRIVETKVSNAYYFNHTSTFELSFGFRNTKYTLLYLHKHVTYRTLKDASFLNCALLSFAPTRSLLFLCRKYRFPLLTERKETPEPDRPGTMRNEASIKNFRVPSKVSAKRCALRWWRNRLPALNGRNMNALPMNCLMSTRTWPIEVEEGMISMRIVSAINCTQV